MRRMLALLFVVVSCCAPPNRPARACGIDLTDLSLSALSEDKAEASRSIAMLRRHGPAGLDVLIDTYRAAIDRHRADPTRAQPMWDRLSAALDGVAAQKDAWAAGLYWYTDLEQAKRAAASSGRPILSLRLLGTLDTELSCANSRFFRTVLYPNAEVGAYLKQNFVLHWQSHRPVPRMTIDFGDGRTIERTITGNSVHYVLDPRGQVVDVIPGLYGPAAFLRAASAARGAVAYVAKPDGRGDPLTVYHRERLAALDAQWAADAARAAPSSAVIALNLPADMAAGQRRPTNPTAMAATRIAIGKSAMEARPVAAFTGAPLPTAATADDATWARIAALHAADGTLDAGSRAVVSSKAGLAVRANDQTFAKRKGEDPITRLVANFERSVAEDTVRNEYRLHRQVHEWFSNGTAPRSLDDLNERVYAELFLMPKSDPWLGLVPADTYTGLPADPAPAGPAAAR